MVESPVLLGEPLGPYRLTATVAEYAGEATPAATPVRVVRTAAWYEGDGTPITEPGRVHALEERLAATQGDAYVPLDEEECDAPDQRGPRSRDEGPDRVERDGV